MKARLVLSGLAASAVMLAAGTAFSGGGAATTDNVLMAFEQKTGHLMAYPDGQQQVSTYLHRAETVHRLADISRYTPPDPCRELATVWNFFVNFQRRTGERNIGVFDGLLTAMSEMQCRATITATDGSGVQPMFSIAPTAK